MLKCTKKVSHNKRYNNNITLRLLLLSEKSENGKENSWSLHLKEDRATYASSVGPDPNERPSVTHRASIQGIWVYWFRRIRMKSSSSWKIVESPAERTNKKLFWEIAVSLNERNLPDSSGFFLSIAALLSCAFRCALDSFNNCNQAKRIYRKSLKNTEYFLALFIKIYSFQIKETRTWRMLLKRLRGKNDPKITWRKDRWIHVHIHEAYCYLNYPFRRFSKTQ